MAQSSYQRENREEMQQALVNELEKLVTTADDKDKDYWRLQFDGFKNLFERHLKVSSTVDWQRIQPIPKDAVHKYQEMHKPTDPAKIKSLLDKLVVVKLNGGLGTSMGCKGPKSLISVRNDLTFLDLTMQQIQHLNKTYDVNVPLVLMNSFNTADDTAKVLKKYGHLKLRVFCFDQSRYPRINRETRMPVAENLKTSSLEDWFPPGHGDFYNAFANSSLLDQFLSEGKEYVFLSNIDNTGATVDVGILNFLLTDEGKGGKQPEFLMEVTDKTRADVKGGTLIQYEGSIRLLEIAQVPKDNVDEFKSVSKFSIFNTNNLWIKMKPMADLVRSKQMEMDIIVNPKHLDSGLEVLQLETAAGAAIMNFNDACAINVPRNRFLPVKKTQDLLLLLSNLYEIQNGTLTLSPKRQFATTPLVKLGTHFDKVHQFMARLPGMPDLLELDHLSISGDVNFGKNVTLKVCPVVVNSVLGTTRGTVIIIANHGDRIDIPMGSILENKIVSGNLRILDH